MSTKQWIGDTLYIVDEEVAEYIDELEAKIKSHEGNIKMRAEHVEKLQVELLTHQWVEVSRDIDEGYYLAFSIEYTQQCYWDGQVWREWLGGVVMDFEGDYPTLCQKITLPTEKGKD